MTNILTRHCFKTANLHINSTLDEFGIERCETIPELMDIAQRISKFLLENEERILELVRLDDPTIITVLGGTINHLCTQRHRIYSILVFGMNPTSRELESLNNHILGRQLIVLSEETEQKKDLLFNGAIPLCIAQLGHLQRSHPISPSSCVIL